MIFNALFLTRFSKYRISGCRFHLLVCGVLAGGSFAKEMEAKPAKRPVLRAVPFFARWHSQLKEGTRRGSWETQSALKTLSLEFLLFRKIIWMISISSKIELRPQFGKFIYLSARTLPHFRKNDGQKPLKKHSFLKGNFNTFENL